MTQKTFASRFVLWYNLQMTVVMSVRERACEDTEAMKEEMIE